MLKHLMCTAVYRHILVSLQCRKHFVRMVVNQYSRISYRPIYDKKEGQRLYVLNLPCFTASITYGIIKRIIERIVSIFAIPAFSQVNSGLVNLTTNALDSAGATATNSFTLLAFE